MLSIIIPALNQHEMTADCVAAIRSCTAAEHEVIIVDNGSDPPLRMPTGGGVKVIRNESNLGFPVAVNQGIRASSGHMIALANNDVIVTPGALDRLCEWADCDFDIVGPVTNFAAGMQRVTLPVYESIEELDAQAEIYSKANKGRFEEVNWVIGFCMVFKRFVYDAIGPFDESLWPCSGEEIDFCFRAREAGYRAAIAMDTYVHHFGSRTFTDLEAAGAADYAEIVTRNDKHLAGKWGEDFWRRQAAVSQSAGIRLNLGCGRFRLPGFINVDQFGSVNPDLVSDALSLPCQPGSVSEIYAGHILEHFRFDDGMKALRYWHGLLCGGGAISVCVPDFDYLARQSLSSPSPRRLMEFNDLYIYSGIQPSPHQYAYSAALLKQVMEDAGFINLARMPVNHPYFPHAVDWQVGYTGFKP